MINFDGKDLSGRNEMSKYFGVWFSEKATPSQLVDWCDARIKKLDEWKANCLKLKNQCQLVGLEGLSEDVLRNALAKLEGKQN